MRRLIAALFALTLLAAPARGAPPASDFPWREWSDEVFAQAARENKFVLLSLQSWWCPWCHVMNTDTYDNAEIRAYLLEHFIPVRVDQDSRPDISQRYERWGWPATVIFAADGTEIVKLRGFYSPKFFLPVLQETVKDPSPVDYGTPGGPERERSLVTGLTDAQRAEIVAFIDKAYDADNGGWGKSKLVDGPTLTWALDRAKAGDKEMAQRARRTIDQLVKMIDSETGAVSQVSLAPDWSKPAREFPMFATEGALKAFSYAYALWGEAGHRAAAARIVAYLRDTLRDANGGFYTSLGRERGNPGIDRSQYARENGQAIAGLLAYYDATGDKAVLQMAVGAAEWALANRRRPDGGFRHAEKDSAGPYLSDSLTMSWALLGLHRSTGERRWLAQAQRTADFIAATFVEARTGGFLVTATPAASVIKATDKQREDNVLAVRLFNLLHFYTGETRYREIAEAGMGYLTSPAVLDAYGFLPDVLQAEDELRHEPVHVTIIGPRDDARTADLQRAALAYPMTHKRAELWDRREGALANHDVEYPEYPEPAAFACTRNFCSLPVTDPGAIDEQLDRLQRALPAR